MPGAEPHTFGEPPPPGSFPQVDGSPYVVYYNYWGDDRL